MSNDRLWIACVHCRKARLWSRYSPGRLFQHPDSEMLDEFMAAHNECSPKAFDIDLTDRRFIFVRDGEVEGDAMNDSWLLNEDIAEIERRRGSYRPPPRICSVPAKEGAE